MKIFLDDERPAPNGWTLMRWPHEVIAALQEDAQHPARWPSWYDHTGRSEPARQRIESIYAIGAKQGINRRGAPDGRGKRLNSVLARRVARCQGKPHNYSSMVCRHAMPPT